MAACSRGGRGRARLADHHVGQVSVRVRRCAGGRGGGCLPRVRRLERGRGALARPGGSGRRGDVGGGSQRVGGRGHRPWTARAGVRRPLAVAHGSGCARRRRRGQPALAGRPRHLCGPPPRESSGAAPSRRSRRSRAAGCRCSRMPWRSSLLIRPPRRGPAPPSNCSTSPRGSAPAASARSSSATSRCTGPGTTSPRRTPRRWRRRWPRRSTRRWDEAPRQCVGLGAGA